VTCPALSRPANGMIECVSAPSPEPTPAPEPTPPVNKRFLQYLYNYFDSEDDSSIGDVCAFSCDDGFVIRIGHVKMMETGVGLTLHVKVYTKKSLHTIDYTYCMHKHRCLRLHSCF